MSPLTFTRFNINRSMSTEVRLITLHIVVHTFSIAIHSTIVSIIEVSMLTLHDPSLSRKAAVFLPGNQLLYTQCTSSSKTSAPPLQSELVLRGQATDDNQSQLAIAFCSRCCSCPESPRYPCADAADLLKKKPPHNTSL